VSDVGTPHARPSRERGIVLAIVLVLIFALTTAVVAFQRRAFIDTTIAQNRLAAAEADALARGGIRIAEAIVYLDHLKSAAAGASGAAAPGGDPADPANPAGAGNPASGLGGAALAGGDLWERVGDYPLGFSRERTLRITIEDEGARLNLNALVPPAPPEGEGTDPGAQPAEDAGDSLDDAELYLIEVLKYVVEGMPGTREEKRYDAEAIARNLIDWMDPDSTARDGRDEDAYYLEQTPPYRARNGPFLAFDEIGMVEGVDGPLLEAMRESITVHPIGSEAGINLNRAKPWVLALVYAGVDGDRRLLGEKAVRAIVTARDQGKILCSEAAGDPDRCLALGEVGDGELAEGSVYPPIELPAETSVFRVVAEAQVDQLVRRIEAVIDTRAAEGPLLLSWRRLRGTN